MFTRLLLGLWCSVSLRRLLFWKSRNRCFAVCGCSDSRHSTESRKCERGRDTRCSPSPAVVSPTAMFSSHELNEKHSSQLPSSGKKVKVHSLFPFPVEKWKVIRFRYLCGSLRRCCPGERPCCPVTFPLAADRWWVSATPFGLFRSC